MSKIVFTKTRGFSVKYFLIIMIIFVMGTQTSCGTNPQELNHRSNPPKETEQLSNKKQNSADVNQNTTDDEADQENPLPENIDPLPPEDQGVTPTDSVPPQPPVKEPVVPQIKKWHTQNGKIYDPSDKEWRGVGANLSNLMGKSRDYITSLVRREADMGFSFIRLWTPNHNSTGPTDMIDRANQTLEIMDIIHANGMQVMLVFWDTYMDLWGNSHRYYRDPEWFKTGYKAEFLDWVNILVPKVKDHPALFMYQLINESSCRETCAVDYINMYSDIAQVIRTMDPIHLISPGGLSLTHSIEGNSFQGDKNRFVEELLKADDQVVWTNSIYNLHEPNVLDLAILKNKIPTIITEYGFCVSSSSPPPKEQMVDSNYGAKAVFDKWHVSGIAAWEATETNCGYANPTNGDFNMINEFKEIAQYIH